MAGQTRIPATYMRGGTSKGVFFRLEDLPEAARTPGPARDKLFQRVIGSPDPYACLLYTSPSPRDATLSRMPSSA